jgi:trk system potassium uptake protein TrkA
VNLSSLGFFRNLRPPNRQFAVIGLGRFGRAVCATLNSLGYEVLGIDTNEQQVVQALAMKLLPMRCSWTLRSPLPSRKQGFQTLIR